jgi:hypothetical protein
MNRRKKIIIAGLFFLAGAFPGLSAPTPDQVEIKFLHQPGKIVRYRNVTKTVGSVKLPAPFPENKYSYISEEEHLVKCIKVNADGSAVYEMSTPRIEEQKDVGGVKSRFVADYTKPTTTPAPQTQPKKSDSSFKSNYVRAQIIFNMTVGPDGFPLKVQGCAESLNNAFKNTGDFTPKEIDSLRQSMTDDKWLKSMKIRFRILPPRRTLKIGDTWTSSYDTKILYDKNVKFITECKLIGIEEFHGRPCIKIQTRESMQPIPAPKSALKPATSQPENPFEATCTANDANGLAYLDYQTGEVVQYHRTQRMTVDAIMKNPPPFLKTSDDKKPFTSRSSVVTSYSLDLLPPTPKTK